MGLERLEGRCRACAIASWGNTGIVVEKRDRASRRISTLHLGVVRVLEKGARSIQARGPAYHRGRLAVDN